VLGPRHKVNQSDCRCGVQPAVLQSVLQRIVEDSHGQFVVVDEVVVAQHVLEEQQVGQVLELHDFAGEVLVLDIHGMVELLDEPLALALVDSVDYVESVHI